MAESDLQRYAGTYTATLDDVALNLRDGGLMLAVTRRAEIAGTRPKPPFPPPVRLAFVGENRVIGLDFPSKGARGELLTDSQGDFVWYRWVGRIHRAQALIRGTGIP